MIWVVIDVAFIISGNMKDGSGNAVQ
jgi:hypothetical protein